uniref:Uncharacterized protein n=1 Tax=Utricularia reniformis TaxID=192314 RepID=A0A1Y0B3J1_9LAMI|nr:hypothetical protein AEK19_MT0863 [Utricularia reniformis]YP_009382272.1 hypothetical protein AEK19_MT1846 [Utricularia reniformis]ART31095.1 hypothetical protein AEK19_MT0863 [Utricularia reniformis]ART32016.1 hypothetical protein AEK19_MT1846 [Utricularia reniformis]
MNPSLSRKLIDQRNAQLYNSPWHYFIGDPGSKALLWPLSRRGRTPTSSGVVASGSYPWPYYSWTFVLTGQLIVSLSRKSTSLTDSKSCNRKNNRFLMVTKSLSLGSGRGLMSCSPTSHGLGTLTPGGKSRSLPIVPYLPSLTD